MSLLVVDGVTYHPPPNASWWSRRPMVQLLDDNPPLWLAKAAWRHNPHLQLCEPCWLRHGVLVCWPALHGVSRGGCDVCQCLGEYALTKDGVLRWHVGDRPDPHGGRLVCGGAGKPPSVMCQRDWSGLIRPEADGDE